VDEDQQLDSSVREEAMQLWVEQMQASQAAQAHHRHPQKWKRWLRYLCSAVSIPKVQTGHHLHNSVYSAVQVLH
jgi:hypothetical protein